MSLEVIDVNEGLGNLIIGKGILTEKEYLETLTRHLTQDENKFKKYRFSLNDYTLVNKVEVQTSAIQMISSKCIAAAKINPDVIMAIIADTDLLFGLARMAEVLMDETLWEIQVFRDKTEAIDWITQRMKVKFNITDFKIQLQ